MVWSIDAARPGTLGPGLRTVTEARLPPVPVPTPPRTPHVPGVSWRPQPARVATRRPGRISDGRKAPNHQPRRPPKPATTPSPSGDGQGQDEAEDAEGRHRGELDGEAVGAGQVAAVAALLAGDDQETTQ